MKSKLAELLPDVPLRYLSLNFTVSNEESSCEQSPLHFAARCLDLVDNIADFVEGRSLKEWNIRLALSQKICANY